MERLRKQWDSLGREDILRLQGARLHRYLREVVLPFSPYYRELFRREGLGADDFRSVADLARLPFTSKQDLLNTPEEPERSRAFVIQPDESVLRRRIPVLLKGLLRGRARVERDLNREYQPMFFTSTTGRSTDPVLFFYSGHDLDQLALAGVRVIGVLGGHRTDRALNLFPYAPHLAVWQCHFAMIEYGIFGLSTGGGKVMGTEGNLNLLKKINPDVVLGMPTFLYHVFSEAGAAGVECPSLRLLMMGGEPAPPGIRRKLRGLVEQLGGTDVQVLASYAFTEAKMAWAECPHPPGTAPGGYHTYPDLGLFEVIDTDSGEVRGEGEPGELVYTPLNSRGSVVLRYRTGDIIGGGLFYDPCPHCGRRLPRLVGDITRRVDTRELRLDKIKGTLVNFNELKYLLDDVDEIGTWQLELRKREDDPHELDELVLHVHAVGGTDEAELVKLINRRFVEHTELRVNEVHFHSPGVMRELQGVGRELKEKRVVDHRATEAKPAPPRVVAGQPMEKKTA
jgi:phenylacetate-coenzyme A ligase PaaK-like adenylate-forming protein